MPKWSRVWRFFKLPLLLVFLAPMLASSSLLPGEKSERVRAFTREIEFDYAGWFFNALQAKLDQLALRTGDYLTADDRHKAVVDYLNLVAQIQQGESQLTAIYADPAVADPEAASTGLRSQLDDLRQSRARLGLVAEGILESQIAEVVAGLGLSVGGQAIPPVLYHSTPLPWALIISPREVIRQEQDISLVPDIPLDRRVALEEQVDDALNVSSLVVGIGGIGMYPTMVAQSSNLDWLSEVVAHEWIHNYLTLRPLGINYLKNPALRTMNETAASIAGKEIGRAVLERYYPELVPAPPAVSPPPAAGAAQQPAEPEFDFNKEMHATRVRVDQLLKEGQVEEAERYMEARRVVFWEHGYRHLRKLNQAYFAFYGAYADRPGGAAGEDPVGAAVRALRAQSPTLADFIRQISWMSSFEELEQAVNAP